MKYRLNIIKDDRNLSQISKYILADKPLYALVEFEEKDIADLIRLVNEVIGTSYSSFSCVGEDGFVYEVSNEQIIKTNCKVSLKKQVRFIKKSYKMLVGYKKHLGHLLDKFSETKSIRKFSVSRFKANIFVSKECDIVFNYRIKKAKTENQPLVIFLPGGGCVGYDNVKPIAEFYGNHIWQKLKKYDCNILIPQTPHVGDFDYIGAVKQLSEHITQEIKADANRIYVFGTSLGGHTTWSSAYKYAEYYACAMPVMGKLREEFIGTIDYNRLRDIPLLVAHSSNDMVVPISGDDKVVEKLNSLSANVRYVRWDKYGHRMASRFYKRENWDEWMFSQSLDER